jgi:DNA-binding transcriptional LysR family regulator
VERSVMLDLIQLRAFTRVADLGSVSGAARSLGMPKSSVSRALARLEEALGAALIERSTRHLRLTDAGRVLHRHAARILDDVSEAENAVGSLIGRPSGTLRVSVGFTFAVGPLAPMLPAFLAAYPGVRVVLTVENRRTDLLTEDVDVAIRIGPLVDSEFIARKLGTIDLWLCGSPAYLATRGTPNSVRDLASHTMISHVDRRAVTSMRTPTGESVEIIIEPGTVIPEPAVAKAILIGGAGIGWLPSFEARDALASGLLVRLLPDHEADPLDVNALFSSHSSLSAKLRVFLDALVTHLKTGY